MTVNWYLGGKILLFMFMDQKDFCHRKSKFIYKVLTTLKFTYAIPLSLKII